MANYLLAGLGFVGNYVANALLSDPVKGNTVTAIDTKQPDYALGAFSTVEATNPKFNYRWVSISDPWQLRHDINTFDAIVFSTAIADVPFAIPNPVATRTVNVDFSHAFFEFLHEMDYNGKIIVMSSESMYGHQPDEMLPMREDVCVPKPKDIYGASKLAQQEFALTLYRSSGMKVTVLISAIMYGPLSRPKQAIPIFLKQAIMNNPITLHGDGSQTRDFNHVANTTDGILLALKAPVNAIAGEKINIGSGQETKFSTLVSAIKLLTKSQSQVAYGPWRAGEQGIRVVLDITKAREKLTYEPRIRLIEGLKGTAQHIAKYDLNLSPDALAEFNKNIGQNYENPASYRGEERTVQPEAKQP